VRTGQRNVERIPLAPDKFAAIPNLYVQSDPRRNPLGVVQKDTRGLLQIIHAPESNGGYCFRHLPFPYMIGSRPPWRRGGFSLAKKLIIPMSP
jgi:hypothetical protein